MGVPRERFGQNVYRGRPMTHALVSRLTVAVIAAAALALSGCSKEAAEAPAPTAPVDAVAPGVAYAPASAPAPAPAPALASASAPAPAPAPASASSAPASSASASAHSPAKPAASAKAAPVCGDKPLPPCPLYAWMKANTSTAMSAEDFDALATALDKVVAFAPAGYVNWVSISKDGASAARAQSLDGVKAACRGCHNQYKDKYKKEMRDRPI
jgi:hypothetical protein